MKQAGRTSGEGSCETMEGLPWGEAPGTLER
jgi:hypothetical protein